MYQSATAPLCVIDAEFNDVEGRIRGQSVANILELSRRI